MRGRLRRGAFGSQRHGEVRAEIEARLSVRPRFLFRWRQECIEGVLARNIYFMNELVGGGGAEG